MLRPIYPAWMVGRMEVIMMEFQFELHRDNVGRWYYVVTVNGRVIHSGTHPQGTHDLTHHIAVQQMESFERQYAKCERCGADDRPRHLYYCGRYDVRNERRVIHKMVLCDRHLKDSDVLGHDRDCIC